MPDFAQDQVPPCGTIEIDLQIAVSGLTDFDSIASLPAGVCQIFYFAIHHRHRGKIVLLHLADQSLLSISPDYSVCPEGPGKEMTIAIEIDVGPHRSPVEDECRLIPEDFCKFKVAAGQLQWCRREQVLHIESVQHIHPGRQAEAAAELVRQVASDRCFSLAGKTTLRQLLVLYTLSEVLVTNDSGPAHFATLTPVRVVTLFGPETPALFAARTPRNTVLWAGIVCSPCVNAYNNRQSPCLNNLCMQAITVDQVFAEVCRALEVES